MREFRQKHGRTEERYWQVWFDYDDEESETVAHAWGAIKKGKHKEHGRTKDRPGPKGKEDTKGWVSAADNAQFNHDRMIRKKLEEGYVEVGLDGRPMLGGSADIIDHGMPLPKNLCFSKPKNSVTDAFIDKAEKKGNVLWTKKVNGMLVIAHITTSGAASLYSRRMDCLTGHFPHLAQALLDLKFPACSILLFEAFWGEGNTEAEFLQVQSVMRSKTGRALDIQTKDGFLKFYLLRIPVWKGEPLEQQHTCEELIFIIENFFADRFIEYREPGDPQCEQFLYTLEVMEAPLPEVMAYGEEHGYEGWVGYVRDDSFLVRKKVKGEEVEINMSYSFHGKPDRPPCAFKKKNEEEDDFICRFDPDNDVGSWGTGKNTGKVGTLSLYQHGRDGQGEVYVCEVGGGLTDSMRDQLLDLEQYPLVAEVRFQSRTYVLSGEKSNALRHPRVTKFRTDKEPEECVNDQLTSPAE